MFFKTKSIVTFCTALLLFIISSCHKQNNLPENTLQKTDSDDEKKIQSNNDHSNDEKIQSNNDHSNDEKIQSNNDHSNDEKIQSNNDHSNDEKVQTENGHSVNQKDLSSKGAYEKKIIDVYFSKKSNFYESPLIYINEENQELRIAEKNGKQTSYGFDGNKDNYSLFKPIALNFSHEQVNTRKIEFALDSRTEHEFCWNLKFKIVDDSIVLIKKKIKSKLTTLTSCTFRLTFSTNEKKLGTNKLIFHFNYTNKDWEANPQATEINRTIKLLSKQNIEGNTEELDLKEKNIKSIVPLLGLANLKKLNITGDYHRNGELSDIRGLSQLKNLEYLYLGRNNLKDIEGLSQLPSLKLLDLRYNKIEKLPDLSQLTSVKTLAISDNSLVDISGLSKVSSLEKLDLSYNKITNLPDLSRLTNLKNVQFEYNQIEEITDLPNLTNTELINLSNNNLRIIPELTLNKIRKAKKFLIYRNPGFPNFRE